MTIPSPTPEDLAADLEQHYAFIHENIVQVSWAKRPETTADQPKYPHQFQHADAKHTTWASAIRRAAAAEAERDNLQKENLSLKRRVGELEALIRLRSMHLDFSIAERRDLAYGSQCQGEHLYEAELEIARLQARIKELEAPK